MPSQSVVLHVCCAPCLATALETIRREKEHPCGEIGGIIFYNPNIHPLLEFRRRVKALRVYLERDPVSAEIDDTYGLREWLARVADGVSDRRERCYRCYLMRLEKAAGIAASQGAEAFSSTLLASREQDLDIVARAGREAGRRAGLDFVQADLRMHLPGEKRLRGIYKQQYCGCIFSEEERFRNTNKFLYGQTEDLPNGGQGDANRT